MVLGRGFLGRPISWGMDAMFFCALFSFRLFCDGLLLSLAMLNYFLFVGSHDRIEVTALG